MNPRFMWSITRLERRMEHRKACWTAEQESLSRAKKGRNGSTVDGHPPSYARRATGWSWHTPRKLEKRQGIQRNGLFAGDASRVSLLCVFWALDQCLQYACSGWIQSWEVSVLCLTMALYFMNYTPYESCQDLSNISRLASDSAA